MAGPLHIALCETAPSPYGMLQDAHPPGKRPGEGEVVATRPDGSKVLRYDYRSPYRGMEGAVTECAMYAGLSVDFVKDIPTAGALDEGLWQECMAAPDITAGTARAFPTE